jgi:hypothetical protein
LTHTFKEEYISKDKVRRTAIELDLHVDEIVEQAKESMSQDATAIRMQTQNFIDKKSRLLLDAHNRCEAALAAAHSRMKDASKAYGDAYEEALNQQLKIVTESTITEDTLNQEMVIAAKAHRDSIQRMTAIPPLVMDDARLQLQIRCAAAEEKAEDLQRERQVVIEKDSEGKIASLQQELGELRKANRISDGKLLEVNSDHDRMRRAARMDESVMVGLKKKLETAESELEGLKRKRADSRWMQATQDGEHALIRWYTLGWGTLMKKAEEGKATRDHGRSYNGPAKRGLLLSLSSLSFIESRWQGY